MQVPTGVPYLTLYIIYDGDACEFMYVSLLSNIRYPNQLTYVEMNNIITMGKDEMDEILLSLIHI